MTEQLARDTLSIAGQVEFKLDSWGIWSTGSLGIGYPCMDMTASMIGRSIPIAPLTDDEGLLIERVMSRLAFSDPAARRAAMFYYQRRYPLEKIGPERQVCRLLDVVREAVKLALFPGLDNDGLD